MQLAGHGHESANGHQYGEAEAGKPQRAMQSHTPRGNQAGLHDQKQNPRGKHSRMHVNQRAGKRGAKDARKIVLRRKSHRNGKQNQQSQSRKKEAVIRAARKALRQMHGYV